MKYDENILVINQGAGYQACEFNCPIFKAFCDYGVVPGRTISSSGSALFSALFFSKGIEWVESMIRNNNPSDFIDILPYQAVKTVVGKSNRLIDNTKIKDLLLENMTGEATKRVTVSVTRIDDWSTHLKKATPAFTLAATSIPFVFQPVKIGNYLWADGGVFNNIPTIPVEETKNWKHIFVIVAPKYVPFEDNSGIWGLLNLLNAVFDREFAQLKESGFFDLPNVTLIQPEDAFGGGLFAWSKDYALMDHCYDLTMSKLKELDLR